MNTSRLKTFAPAVRRQLMEAVGRKLDYVLTADTPDLRQVSSQIAALRKEAEKDRAALVERVAYTWFNRLAALRFLDARGWHPFSARVLTPATADETQPGILSLLRTGTLPEELRPHTDLARLNDLLDGRLPTAIAGADPRGEAYRGLILAACRYYHALMPFLFEAIDDETELLLPDDLLTATSVAEGFRAEITDEDCAEVEILGWLYQFYISEKKDQVMARKKAVPSEDIPAVTQLFTPHWIVRYLVENSLGRLWLNSRPHSRLREHMPYYVEDPAPEPPAWEPEWTEKGVDFREGDYQTLLWLRPNPVYSGDYDRSHRYAMSIDGYAYARDRWGIDATGGEGEPKLEEFEAKGWGKVGFADLRFCLFLVQRGIKWTDDRDGLLTKKYHAIYEALCKAWDREWRKHEKDLPDLARYGIRMPEAKATEYLTVTTPEEIKLLDPASGSGHMLTYAFDLLVKIYVEEGHAPGEIPEKILTHNLFGLEICPRAAQLASFALVCKAREHSRSAFRRPVHPKIMCLRDVVLTPEEVKGFTDPTGVTFSADELAQLHQFRENTATFGSLIQPVLDVEKLAALRAKIGGEVPAGDLLVQNTHRKLRLVLVQAEMLSQRYQVVVGNPPYLNKYSPELKEFIKHNFKDFKSDLFAAFIVRSKSLAVDSGLLGFMTPFVWMFISTYERLRTNVLSQSTLTSLVQLEYSGFDGATVPICTFTIENKQRPEHKGAFIRLSDFRGHRNQAPRTLEAIQNPDCGWFFRASTSDFEMIPGSPIAYWVSDHIRDLFKRSDKMGDVLSPHNGLQTNDTVKFLRFWHEPSRENVGIGIIARDAAKSSGKRWFPYNKGGGFRKWYGNHEFIVNWKDDGFDIKERKRNDLAAGRITANNSKCWNESHYFEESVSWSDVTSSKSSFRYSNGHLFDITGPSVFPNAKASTHQILSYLNGRFLEVAASALNPTLHFTVGDFRLLPCAMLKHEAVVTLVDQLITLSRADWDNFETSWDFCDLPLLRSGDWEVKPGQVEGGLPTGAAWKGRTLAESWSNYAAYCTAAIRRMQELETENNRLWIEAYGLQDELPPEVPLDEITLARADQRKDVAAFLSYAIGCMMGRYSLDQPGLILADAGDTVEHYLAKVGKPLDELSFRPDEDGIVPVLEGEWFEDDLVARTREFLRATFGEDTLNENLRFIEESLGKPLEKYFLTDFYKDHLQTYKKRPLYWLFQSPKKGFGALVYLHRYTRDTVNTLLNRYLRDYLHKLDSRITHLVQVEATSTAPKDKTAARKERERLEKARKDCRDWERDIILPLAQKRLEIDLDDGVKVNYQKFEGAVAPIAGLAAKEE
jgi:hypothetical protein